MEVFTIPHEGQHILYFPFRRTVLLGNAALVNLAHRAKQGDAAAAQRLSETLGHGCEGIGIDMPDDHPVCARPQPGPFQPTSVSLLLTEDCTLRCKYCYAHGGKSRRSMPWEMVTGVIDTIFTNARAAGLGTVAVNFHGGDAGAVWPLLVKTRDYLRDKETSFGIHVLTSVGTNGVLDHAQRLWLTENIDSATVSVDGPPAIHDSQRILPDGSPSSGFVVKTMGHFDRVKFRYGIRSTITADRVERMDEIAHFLCTTSAAKKIQMEPMFPQGRAGNGGIRAPGAQEFVDNFRKARQVALAFDRTLYYSGARLDVLTNVFCKACGDSCVVTPGGDITSCYEIADAEDPLAQIFFFGRFDLQTRSFGVDEDRRARLFGLSVLDKPRCMDCFCKWHCAGDCPAKVLHAERASNRDLPDRCQINRELTKDQLVAALRLCLAGTLPASMA
jgi:radical SAM additional 4Fe4S-binding domain